MRENEEYSCRRTGLLTTLSFPESIMTCTPVLTFKFKDKMLWGDYSNEIFLAVPILFIFSIFCKMEFGIFHEF